MIMPGIKLNNELQNKLQKIKKYFKGKSVIVAFSGGVDSSVVSEFAHRFSKRSVIVTADSITVLPGEIELAKKLAIEQGWEHRIVKINELEEENFAANPSNRCYYCKTGLSEKLNEIANEIQADIIVEGTNVSEISGHRPGLQAIREAKIQSPLLLYGLSKPEIRELARYYGLSNSEKPSLACLSSRFPYGVRITPEKLKRVGLAERYIIDTYHIDILRVRDHEGLARIEVAPNERSKLISIDILNDLQINLKKFGFNYVTIDVGGYRTGSLNDVLDKESIEKSSITTLNLIE